MNKNDLLEFIKVNFNSNNNIVLITEKLNDKEKIFNYYNLDREQMKDYINSTFTDDLIDKYDDNIKVMDWFVEPKKIKKWVKSDFVSLFEIKRTYEYINQKDRPLTEEEILKILPPAKTMPLNYTIKFCYIYSKFHKKESYYVIKQ
jgi:hypothetical protein